jgi:hypothetical protein
MSNTYIKECYNFLVNHAKISVLKSCIFKYVKLFLNYQNSLIFAPTVQYGLYVKNIC